MTKLFLLFLFFPHAVYACTAEVGFSPQQGAQELVIQAIAAAQKTIHLAAYQLTSVPVIRALKQAQNEGKEVQIIVDKSQRSHPDWYGGLDVVVNSRHHIFHDKFIVIDGRTVETGSFNFTKAAHFVNAENVVVLHDCQNITDAFEAQFKTLWDESDYLLRITR